MNNELTPGQLILRGLWIPPAVSVCLLLAGLILLLLWPAAPIWLYWDSRKNRTPHGDK